MVGKGSPHNNQNDQLYATQDHYFQYRYITTALNEMRDKWRLQKTIEHHMYSRNPINLAFSVGNILRDVKKQREEKKQQSRLAWKERLNKFTTQTNRWYPIEPCAKKNTCKLQLYRHALNTEQTDSHTYTHPPRIKEHGPIMMINYY